MQISEWLVIFMGFMLLIAGGLIGAGVMGFFWLKATYKGLIYKLDNIQIQTVEKLD